MSSRTPNARHPRRSLRRTGFIGALGVSLVAAAFAATISAGPASAHDDDDPAPPNGTVANLIVLGTGEHGSYAERFGATGTSEARQSIGNARNSCVMATSSTVLEFTSTGLGAGLKAGSIGSAEAKSGLACGQVNTSGSETLTMKLAAGTFADLAVLDIEVQKNVVVRATTFVGSTAVGQFELQSGTSGGATPDPAGAVVSLCNRGASSSGPNSSSSDNCRWVIDGAVFDRIQLKAAAAGQFSLEGGADGASIPATGATPAGLPTNVSYFRQAVPCTASNSTFTFTGSGTPTGSVTRGENADGTDCLFIPVTLTPGAGTLELVKTGAPYSQFIVDVTWTANLNELAKVTEVDFGNVSQAMELCPSALRNPATGALVDLDEATLPDDPTALRAALSALGIEDMDGDVNTPVQYSCSGIRTPTWNGSGYNVTEQIYLLGDVVWRG